MQIKIKSSGLVVDISQASVFPSQRSIDSPLPSRDEISKKLKEAKDYANILAPAEGLAPLWTQADEVLGDSINLENFKSLMVRSAIPPILSLISGIREKNIRLITESVHSLTGLGVGLTPSGDDVLTGLLAAIVLLSQAQGTYNRFLSITENIVSSATGRSNTLSLTYLRHASRGEITNTLSSYISSLVSQGYQSIEEVTKQLFSYGATSGSELAFGAYLGVALLVSQIDQ